MLRKNKVLRDNKVLRNNKVLWNGTENVSPCKLIQAEDLVPACLKYVKFDRWARYVFGRSFSYCNKAITIRFYQYEVLVENSTVAGAIHFID